MLLDLRDVIRTPDAAKSFQFCLDLSDQEFYGAHPITQPVQVRGRVVNRGGALMMEGTARSVLELNCDRCLKAFSREKVVDLNFLLAEELCEEDNEEIILLREGMVDLDEVATTAFILGMDTKNLCSEDCKGLCDRCGADLNLGPCDCKPEPDPRWAALAQLLEDERE